MDASCPLLMARRLAWLSLITAIILIHGCLYINQMMFILMMVSLTTTNSSITWLYFYRIISYTLLNYFDSDDSF